MDTRRKQLYAEKRRYGLYELKVQALASRNAREKMLRVPWRRFRWAYSAYPEWLALTLWARTIVGARGEATPEVLSRLRRHCPKFLKAQNGSFDANVLGFQLLEWIHENVFRDAKQEGWLEALTFFATRHVHSRAAWSLWEQCEEDRQGIPPEVFRSFENWRRRSLETPACGERTYSRMAATVERYLRFESVVSWIDPLLISGSKIPELTVRELVRQLRLCCRRSPSIAPGAVKGGSAYWRAVIRSAKRSFLRDAVSAACISEFEDCIHRHPWNVRLNAYRKTWAGKKAHRFVRHYPTFRQWLLDAERFVIHSGS